jgi:hypothetical protein
MRREELRNRKAIKWFFEVNKMVRQQAPASRDAGAFMRQKRICALCQIFVQLGQE